MSPDDFSQAFDKFICDYLPPGLDEQYIQIERFKNEVDQRGLCLSKCGLKNIQKTPFYCYGYVRAESKQFYDLSRTDDVDLFFREQDISKSYVIVGKVIDQSSVTDPSQYLAPKTSTNIFDPELWSKEIDRRIIKDKFEKTYKKRSQEVRSDALLVSEKLK